MGILINRSPQTHTERMSNGGQLRSVQREIPNILDGVAKNEMPALPLLARAIPHLGEPGLHGDRLSLSVPGLLEAVVGGR
jgi:hypothetical protein